MRHQLDGNWEDFCTGVVAYYAALMDSVRGNAQLIDCEELQPASLRFLTFFARYWAFPAVPGQISLRFLAAVSPACRRATDG